MSRFLGVGLAALALWTTGCEGIGGDDAETPVAPTAQFVGVELVSRPTSKQLGSFYCVDLVGKTPCGFVGLGNAPRKTDLRFSFETVFELGNANTFPVPLVEMLLALTVFEGGDQAELGALCVSFCDPEAEGDCEPNRPDACRADQAVSSLEDFVPTVDQLIELAVKAATGELFDDNLGFRFIPARQAARCMAAEEGCEARDEGGVASLCCGDECTPLGTNCFVRENDAGETCEMCPGRIEARIRFDLDLDTMVNVLGELASQSLDELAAGRSPTFDIPYSALGSLFFDVPVLGRFALDFGPLADTWSLD